MRGFNLILGVLVFVFLVGVSYSYAPDILNCTNITEPGEYVIGTDITGNHSVNGIGACIFINSSNVSLDGVGYSLTGLWSGNMNTFGIYLNESLITNVTITSLTILNYTYGISLNYTNDTTVQYCNIYNNSYGISLLYANYTTIRHINLSNNTIAINLYGGQSNKLSSLRVFGNNGIPAAIKFDSANDPTMWNVLNDSYIYNNRGNATRFNFVNVTNITNNHIYNNSGYGIYLYSVNTVLNTTIADNYLYNNTDYAIMLYGYTDSIGNTSILNNYIYTNQSRYFYATPPSSGQYHFNITNLYISSSLNGGQSYIKFNSVNYNASSGALAVNNTNIALGTDFASGNASSLGVFNSSSITIQLYWGSTGSPRVYYNTTGFFTTNAIPTDQSLIPTTNGQYAHFTVSHFSGYLMSHIPPAASPTSDSDPDEGKTEVYLSYTYNCRIVNVTAVDANERPLSGLRLKMTTTPGSSSPSVFKTTDSNGKAKFDLPYMSYTTAKIVISLSEESTYVLKSSAISINVSEECAGGIKEDIYFYHSGGCSEELLDHYNCNSKTLEVQAVNLMEESLEEVVLYISYVLKEGETVEQYETTDSNGWVTFNVSNEGEYTIKIGKVSKDSYNWMCGEEISFDSTDLDYCEDKKIYALDMDFKGLVCDPSEADSKSIVLFLKDEDGKLVYADKTNITFGEFTVCTGEYLNAAEFKLCFEEDGEYLVSTNGFYSGMNKKEYGAASKSITIDCEGAGELSVDVSYVCLRNTVFVTVTDQDGNLVENAKFQVTDLSQGAMDYGTPDYIGNGKYRFNEIIEGPQTFLATIGELRGYGTIVINCTDFNKLSITICDPDDPECVEGEEIIDGVPEGATVNVYGPDGSPVTVTQKDGKYTFTPLAGNYTIEIVKDGSVISGQVIEVLPKSLDKDNAIKKFLDSTEGKILLLALILILLVYWYQRRRSKQRAAKYKRAKK